MTEPPTAGEHVHGAVVPDWLRQLLVCPVCRVPLRWSDEAGCSVCGRHYPVVDGIPVLLTEDARGDGHKAGQAAHFDHAVAHEFEVERPRGTPALYRFLIEEKLRRSVRSLRLLLPGATVLVVCGGSGMEAEFLARQGARVICSDISLGAAGRAAERARRHGVSFTVLVADVERLPFADRGVDLAYVHDGLHHLPDPTRGLREMTRVARWALSVNEPARAAFTRLAVRLGWALAREEAGNPVMRLSRAEVVALLRERGFAVVRAERYAMHYQHEPSRLCAILSRRGWLVLTVGSWRLMNALVGRFGNKLAVQAVR